MLQTVDSRLRPAPKQTFWSDVAAEPKRDKLSIFLNGGCVASHTCYITPLPSTGKHLSLHAQPVHSKFRVWFSTGHSMNRWLRVKALSTSSWKISLSETSTSQSLCLDTSWHKEPQVGNTQDCLISKMAPGLLYNFSSRFRCVFQSVWIGLNASSHICGGGALGRGREGDWGMLRTVYVSVFFFY